MVDDRFSSEAFETCGLDTQAALDLADLLADEIQREMHNAIKEHFFAIIERLNKMGHELKPVSPPVPGHISYRDDREDGADYCCKLRVAFDIVISTGYAHLAPSDEEAG